MPKPTPVLRASRREALTVTTQAQDVASAMPPSRRRIVGYNAGISGLAACALLGVFGFCWGLLASPTAGPGPPLERRPPMCLMAPVFCLLGTCRLVVDPTRTQPRVIEASGETSVSSR